MHYSRSLIALLSQSLSLSLLLALPAYAKKVVVEWAPMEGAVEYEIKVDGEAKKVEGQRLKSPKWKSEMPAGVYNYQIRAFDKKSRAGDWTPVQNLVVMPPAPEQSFPKDGSDVPLYDPKQPVTLKWKGTPGINYAVTVKRNGRPVLTKNIKGTEISIPDLPSGNYEWDVRPVLKIQSRSPASNALSAKTWEGESAGAQEFKLEYRTLAQPEVVSPLGVIPPPKDGRLLFEWKPVEGAKGYEVRFPKGKPFVTKESKLPLKLQAPGTYTWQVRALASVEDTGGLSIPGPDTTSTFKMDPNALFRKGSGYVAFSSMLAPYAYRVNTPMGNGSVDSVSATARVSGEYWAGAQWGVGWGAEDTVFKINNTTYNRYAFELTGKYRATLDQNRFGWFVAPKAGIEERDYLFILQENGPTSGYTSHRGIAWGLSLGVDVRKQFSERWSLGLKASYFLPLQVSADGADGFQITPNASYRNLNIGAQAVYWLGGGFALNAGAYAEARSISVRVPDQTRATMDVSIYMDGVYFFGSLIYTW